MVLRGEDRALLEKSVNKQSSTGGRQYTRARVLLMLSEGCSAKEISNALDITSATVFGIKKRYKTSSLDETLEDKPRSGRPLVIDQAARARISELAASAPPSGHTRWSLRLLANKAMEMGLIGKGQSVSHATVQRILKKQFPEGLESSKNTNSRINGL